MGTLSHYKLKMEVVNPTLFYDSLGIDIESMDSGNLNYVLVKHVYGKGNCWEVDKLLESKDLELHSIKWYEFESDMQYLSSNVLGIIFKLITQPEESFNIVKYTWYNGSLVNSMEVKLL